MDSGKSAIFLFKTGNTLFGPIWLEKIKIFNLSWNLAVRLIQICRIQWWCSLFSVFVEKQPFFLVNLAQKIKIVSLRWALVTGLIRICRIQWWCYFSVFDQKYLFWIDFVQKVKLISLRSNLIASLIRICRIPWWCISCTPETPYSANLVQKTRIVSLN